MNAQKKVMLLVVMVQVVAIFATMLFWLLTFSVDAIVVFVALVFTFPLVNAFAKRATKRLGPDG
jgi:hypothetical protein